MNDTELQKIADKALNKWSHGKWNKYSDFDTLFKSVVFESLTQVRDAQENKIAMLEANEAVQNALISDLNNQLKIAREALNRFCKATMRNMTADENDGSHIIEHLEAYKNATEALERIGDV